jgi:transcriptional regulator with XRE-family HTH domain
MRSAEKQAALREYARAVVTEIRTRYPTQAALAAALGCDQATVSEILSGRRAQPYWPTVKRAAELAGRSPRELFFNVLGQSPDDWPGLPDRWDEPHREETNGRDPG